jgi:putative oxidoreductase
MGAAQSYGITLLRLVAGVIYVMHGYLGLAVLGPGALAGYVTRMGYPAAYAPVLAWYAIGVHLVGGLFLVLGLWPRWAALAQLPVMASAVALLHYQQGFFMKGIIVDAAAGRAIAGGYEFSLLLLVATLALVLTGGGALGLDGRR